MTDDEQGRDLLSAVKKYSENKGKMACLMRRLHSSRQALAAFRDNPANAEAQEAIKGIGRNPKDDALEFLRVGTEQDQLRDLFRARNLDIE